MNKLTRQVLLFSLCSAIFLGVIYILNRPRTVDSFSKYHDYPQKINSKESETITKKPIRDLASQRENLIQATKAETKKGRTLKSRQNSLLNLKTKMQRKKSAKMVPVLAQTKELITTNEKNYQLVKDVYAIEKSKIDEVNNIKIIDQKLGYYIIEEDGAIPEEAIRVLQNQDSGTYAIFTGVLKVKLVDMSDVDGLFSTIPYEIHSVHEDINLVFYRFFNYSETIEAFNSLKDNSELSTKIMRVTIELLEFERGTR